MLVDTGRLYPVGEYVSHIHAFLEFLTHEVKCRVLRFEKRQESTTSKGFAIQARAKMMGRVSAGGHIRYLNDGSESILKVKVSIRLNQNPAQYSHHPNWP